jgi:gamma-glutamyltranspeptidase / glutathione hydrolase
MPDPFPFASRRSPVLATEGMVATSHPRAARAGIEVLAAGGNAADAAVATAAALNVVEPCSTGVGGDAFALVYEAATGGVRAVNGSGRSGRAVTRVALSEHGVDGAIPRSSAHAVTVPGAVAAWEDTVTRHGRLPLADVLVPAIRLAEEGCPVTPIVAHLWARSEALLGEANDGPVPFLPGGRAPRAGEVFRNPDLAQTLLDVADGGSRAFYEGRAAAALVAAVAERGGLLDAADLADHQSTFEAPLDVPYHDRRVFECAPNGQGLAALIALRLIEPFPINYWGPRSADALHVQIEALRLAFADARRYIADRDHEHVPVDELLSDAHCDARRALIDPDRAMRDVAHGDPFASSDTVYLAVVDGEGNACSFINSNYQGFGTGIVPQGCGFTLQNRGSGFSLDPGHPNVVAPRKRPYHTIIPALSTHADGALHACFGVMGGYMQPQGHVQVFSHLVDHGKDAQQALDEPRFSIGPDGAGAVRIEEGVPEAALDELRRRGHQLSVARGGDRLIGFGRGQVIVRAGDGVLWGGSDGRCDGAAVGL